MAQLFPTANTTTIATTTAVATGTAVSCRGYSVVVADVTITDTAQVNFKATADGGQTYRYIIGAPTVGTSASVSATSSGHYRFNVTGMDAWIPVISTISVGSVQVNAIAQSGGTDAVVSQAGGSAVTQGGGFDVRLITSTATIGTVAIVAATVTQTVGTNLQTAANQSGPWDVRLIASTPTIGTTTSVNQKSSVIANRGTISIGTFASPTLAANTARKSLWFQNVSTNLLYLGFGNTPTATSYDIALASTTVAHDGTGGYYTNDLWLGQVNVIAGAATATLTFGEFT